MESKEFKLNIGMGFATLLHTCRLKVDIFRRDLSELAIMGITEEKINDFEIKTKEFQKFRFDESLLLAQSEATKLKNEIAEQLRGLIRIVIIQIQVSSHANVLDIFNSKALTKLSVDNLLHFTKKLLIEINENNLIENINLNQSTISEIEIKSEQLKQANVLQHQAVIRRDLETKKRREKALELFELLSKYCRLAQTYWYEKDEARYNDFFIHKKRKKTKKTAPETKENINGGGI